MDYLVTDPARTTRLRSLGEGRWHLTEEPVTRLHRTFVDTFDWAVYRAGATLEWRRPPPQPALVWSALDNANDTCEQDAPTPPAFPADLPPGPVRTRLLKIAEQRRLLPVMDIATRMRTLRIRDADRRPIAHLTLADSRFEDPRGGGGNLTMRLRLHPVPGEEDQCAPLLKALEDALALAPANASPLLEALAAAGRRPADYSTKIDHRLDPQARADTVAKEVLRALLATIEANLDGTRANLDAEFLHDLRVANRRTRSALGQLHGVFPAAVTAHFKAEFAWLQEVTGPVRDLDVYLLEFDAYRQALAAPLRPDLEPLRTFLRAHYEALQQQLVRDLDSARFTRLLADWRTFLEAPVPAGTETPNGGRPIKGVADRRLRALAKRVRREGRRIGPDSPPEDLHELRKSCKKLRYLLEFFQSLYPKDAVRALIGVMKGLLDNLGGFQDLAVQAAHLRGLAQQMRDEDQAGADALLAVGAVVGHLLERQRQAREDFDQVFAVFMRDEHQQRFRSLLDPDREDDATP